MMNKIFLILLVLIFSDTSNAIDSISVSKAVIVDQKNEFFYLMSADKKLIALKTSGEELWQSPINARPLFLVDDYLISMKDASTSGVLKLLVLRAATGEIVNNLEVALPKLVIARIDESMNQKFDLDVHSDSGQTYLTWKYLHKKVGGSYNGDDNRIIVNTDGQLKIDFDSSRVKLAVTPIDDSKKIETALIIPQVLKKSWDNREIVTQAVVFGENYHSIGYDSGRAYIKTFSTSDGRATGRIKLDQPLGHLYKISAEKENVVTPRRLLDNPFFHYEWLIHDMLDGHKIGSVKSHYSSNDYYVKSNKIYYVEDPWKRRIEGGKFHSQTKSLIGYDFALEKQMWRIEIRDTRNFGPTPP